MGAGRLWNGWTTLGASIGDFQGRAVLTLFYFTIAAPFGLISRLFVDSLRRRAPEGSAWIERPALDPSLERARNQF